MLCVNTLNTPGCCAAPVALTKDLKVLQGDLPPTNLSPLFTIYARPYQLLLPLFEKYLRLLLSDGGECNPFLSSWPPTNPKPPFFFTPSQFYLHFATCLLFLSHRPGSIHLLFGLALTILKCQIALCFCLFFFMRCRRRYRSGKYDQSRQWSFTFRINCQLSTLNQIPSDISHWNQLLQNICDAHFV